MIDAAVQTELKKFKSFWAAPLAVSPYLALDDSWLSLAVIDSLTFALRGKDELSDFERQLVRGASAYIANIAAVCWEKFGAEASAEYQDTGIIIRAARGPQIAKDQEVVIHIERDLRTLLETTPVPFRVFSTFERVISPIENFVSPFAFSVFCGLTPTGEGPWVKETAASFAPHIEKVVKHLAGTAASAYERIYPDEPIGQVPELYLRSLIYPLTMMEEDLPLRHGVRGALDFFAEYKVSAAKAAQVTFNLARLADDRIAGIGFVFATVLMPVISPELRAIAFSNGTTVGLYRRAMLDVREHFGQGGDWLGKQEYSEQDALQIAKEIDLGYFPWLRMSKTRVLASAGDTEIQRLLISFCEFNFKQAVLQLDQLIELTPDDMQLRLQRCFLDIVEGDVEKADKSLKTLLSEPLAEDQPMIYDLAGTVKIILRDLAAADQYMKRARTLAGADPGLVSEVFNNSGWLELLRGKNERAIEYLDESLKHLPDQLVTLLNKATVLHQQPGNPETAELDRRLLELAPTNRQVFRALVFDSVAA